MALSMVRTTMAGSICETKLDLDVPDIFNVRSSTVTTGPSPATVRAASEMRYGVSGCRSSNLLEV